MVVRSSIGIDQPSWILVTPKLAEEWMEKNTINRPVRTTWVRYLSEQMSLNRFERTTDAIGFRHDGVLVNGQHRLLAIIDSGVSCQMIVVHGLSDHAFQVTDRGAGRTLADVLKMPPHLLADAGLLLRLISDMSRKRNSEEDVADTAAWWSPAYHSLYNTSAGVRGLSSAGIRVGFGVRWAIQGTQQGRSYVQSQFKALMQSDTDVMTKATAALWKRLIQSKPVNGSNNSNRTHHFAVQCFYCADPIRAMIAPVITNPSETLEELREAAKEMEAAYLAAPRGAPHPYNFTKEVEQRRVAPRVDHRRGSHAPKGARRDQDLSA